PAAVTKKELFLRACRGESLPRVPVWMMRQAGRYLPEYRELRAKHAFLEVCKTPELAVEVSLQPFRRLGVDAIIVFSDILIVAEAMGLALELGDAGPNLPSPVRTAADVSQLKSFDPESETRFLMDALRILRREAGPDVPVLGFAAAPWTLACYMVEGRTKEGFATVKNFLHREPRVFRDLLHRIAQATIGYLRAQIAAGAAAVQLFDTWCGELSLADYQTFALPVLQEIVREVVGHAPVIYYTKASHHLLPAVVESGANVLSVDWRVNLAELRKLAGPRVGIQGNLDPALLYAPQDVLVDETKRILGQLGGVGHILNLGHGILPTTPVENAQLFIKTGQEAIFPASAAASIVR
ncbi:MAG TPA: uroporphyrinogen decarboxylase, partial [Candidatus Acidoferrum sp.]|nr:uroporphyrinogen decarboxylase [Candidatus Acidoferrum sp.]